jgi:surface antigen
MKTLLISLILTISLSGCFTSGLPSGIVNYSCEPNCQSKDFYLPGKGVWAENNPINKAKIGAGLGTIAGIVMTHGSGDPLLISAAAVAGLVVGHEIGATFDKIDQMYATMLLTQSLNNNQDMQSSTWKHPNKNIAVNAMPITSEGECREFVTSVQVGNELQQMRGTACLINNEWELRELY